MSDRKCSYSGCHSFALKNRDKCFAHCSDLDVVEKRNKARRKGGKRSRGHTRLGELLPDEPIQTIGELKLFTARLLNAYARGELSERTITQGLHLTNTLTKLIELEKRDQPSKPTWPELNDPERHAQILDEIEHGLPDKQRSQSQPVMHPDLPHDLAFPKQ